MQATATNATYKYIAIAGKIQGSMQWLACHSCVNRTANLGHCHPTFTVHATKTTIAINIFNIARITLRCRVHQRRRIPLYGSVLREHSCVLSQRSKRSSALRTPISTRHLCPEHSVLHLRTSRGRQVISYSASGRFASAREINCSN